MMAVHFIYSWPVVYAEKNDQQTWRRTEGEMERERGIRKGEGWRKSGINSLLTLPGHAEAATN